MDEKEYARLRLRALEEQVGSALKPVETAGEYIGRWEMRFGGLAVQAGLVGSEVQWIYDFAEDGTLLLGKEKGQWAFLRKGTESYLVITPPGAAGPLYKERKLAFKSEDG